ncbi:MAG: RuBisCO large subunit C-terminal-like domain-containing protein [Chloroflexota bacterium]|nr:RuBisCO large subunit C-terminal-like domain-containing protein [Chloroflexota bacterium]
MTFSPVTLEISGERFQISYLISGGEALAIKKAQDVCLEQTVELSDSMVPDGDLRDHIVGQIENYQQVEADLYEFKISYAVEITGFELAGLLSVIFGNTSMKRGVRVQRAVFPDSLLAHFPGPRFGTKGLRKLLEVPSRPLLGTALKPVGYSPGLLAESAYSYALGGIDIIKDDHGLINQPFATFQERTRQCAAAVNRANKKTGGKTLYVPNISGPVDQVVERAMFAKDAGAGGVELYSGIVGYDFLRVLAEDDRIGLPIFNHPALVGTYFINPREGISHEFLFGQLVRLAGADAAIFTSIGGRFPTTRKDCQNLAVGAARPMGKHIKPILLMPGGGMTIDRVEEMLDLYGNDVILLISGGLFSIGPDLVANCQKFKNKVVQYSSKWE